MGNRKRVAKLFVVIRARETRRLLLVASFVKKRYMQVLILRMVSPHTLVLVRELQLVILGKNTIFNIGLVEEEQNNINPLSSATPPISL